MAAAAQQAAAAARATENDRTATRATIQVEAEIGEAIVLDADEEECVEGEAAVEAFARSMGLVSQDTYVSIPPPGSASESSFAMPGAVEGASVLDAVLHQGSGSASAPGGEDLGQSVVSTSVHRRAPSQAVGPSTEVVVDVQTSDYIVLEADEEECVEGEAALEAFERSMGLVSKDSYMSAPPPGSASESSFATPGSTEGTAVHDALLHQPLAVLGATSSCVGPQSLCSADGRAGPVQDVLAGSAEAPAERVPSKARPKTRQESGISGGSSCGSAGPPHQPSAQPSAGQTL